MARGIKFQVFKSNVDKKFYYRILGGNGEQTNPSESYGRLRDAIRATEKLWSAFAVAMGVTSVALNNIPYTEDSLKPRKRPAKKDESS